MPSGYPTLMIGNGRIDLQTCRSGGSNVNQNLIIIDLPERQWDSENTK